MTDQIKDEKEFREFYQGYLDGHSTLSDLYQQSETVQPSAQLDEVILSAAKKQTNKSHLVSFPAKNHTRYYSIAASFAIFSLLGLLVFNTWEAEKKQMEESFSGDMGIPSEADYIAPPMPQAKLGINSSTPVQKPAPLKKDRIIREEESLADMAAPVMEKARAMKKADTSTTSNTMPIEQPAAAIMALPAEKLRRQPESAAPLSLEQPIQQSLSDQTKQKQPKPIESTEGKYAKKEQLSYSQSSSHLSAIDWVEKIRTLLINQQIQQAQNELKLFRKAYPNYPIEPELLEKLEKNG